MAGDKRHNEDRKGDEFQGVYLGLPKPVGSAFLSTAPDILLYAHRADSVLKALGIRHKERSLPDVAAHHPEWDSACFMRGEVLELFGLSIDAISEQR